MNISLKYNDLCVRAWVYHKTILEVYYNNEKLIPGNIAPFWIQCPHCNKNIRPFYNKNECYNSYKKVEFVCDECNSSIHFDVVNQKFYIYSYKYEHLKNVRVIEKPQKVIVRNEKEMYKFRNGPVPRLWRRRTNLNKHGNSKKGLIFSSFRNSFDEQVYDYEADDINVIKYKGKVQSTEMRYNELDRHRPVRSWKRSKKRKQWM